MYQTEYKYRSMKNKEYTGRVYSYLNILQTLNISFLNIKSSGKCQYEILFLLSSVSLNSNLKCEKMMNI